jgi:hypothetical protein
MKREEVLQILAANQERLKALGVKSLDLFGSVARDEARSDSDVDFLVEFTKPGPPTPPCPPQGGMGEGGL